MQAKPLFVAINWAAITPDGGVMEKINLPFFYDLGAKLHDLVDTRIDSRTKWQIIFSCQEVTKQLKVLFETFPVLEICRPKGVDLVKTIDAWLDSTRKPPQATDQWGKPPTPPESFGIFNMIRQAAQFEVVLTVTAELQNLATYHATQKGIYSTADLINVADKMLPEPIRKKMTSKVLEEIRQSGRCLAFDNATASGFHIMRATELVMHEFYLEVCKPNPSPIID